jgi:chromosome partitioning protein
VVELWDYVADRLEKNFRRTVFAPPATGGYAAHPAMARPAAGFGRRVVGQ